MLVNESTPEVTLDVDDSAYENPEGEVSNAELVRAYLADCDKWSVCNHLN